MALLRPNIISVNGKNGVVVLTTNDISENINLYFTNPRAIGATLTGYASGSGVVSATDSILTAINKLNGNASLLAPISSPTFTGIPAAPTATVGTNTTQIATTAYVIAAVGGAAAVSSVFGRTGAVVASNGDYSTAMVSESGNLYFTNARSITSLLTAYSAASGVVTSADSVLSAIQKIDANEQLLPTIGISIMISQTNYQQ